MRDPSVIFDILSYFPSTCYSCTGFLVPFRVTCSLFHVPSCPPCGRLLLCSLLYCIQNPPAVPVSPLSALPLGSTILGQRLLAPGPLCDLQCPAIPFTDLGVSTPHPPLAVSNLSQVPCFHNGLCALPPTWDSSPPWPTFRDRIPRFSMCTASFGLSGHCVSWQSVFPFPVAELLPHKVVPSPALPPSPEPSGHVLSPTFSRCTRPFP